MRMIIDTDTASDDAVALVLALRNPAIQVEAITVVAGNLPLEQCVQNALYTVELCGAQTPVYAGRAAPLLRAPHSGESVHGRDGMGDIGLPLSGRDPAPGHAVDVLLRTIGGAPGEITLVTLGPLSNVALALLRDPSIAQKVRRCYIMGGTSDGYGNVSAVAEYNIWADPEAARVVFDSGMPITMIGWDISRKYAVIDRPAAATLRAIGTPLAHFCIDIQATLQSFTETKTKLAGFDLADPIAMAIAIDPSIATRTLHVPVLISTDTDLSRGQTVIDHRNLSGRTSLVDVVVEADHARFIDQLAGMLV
jgi:purine nucleosidase